MGFFFDICKDDVLGFVDSCSINQVNYRLSVLSEESPYARCFAIFIRNLLGDTSLKKDSNFLINAIVKSVKQFHSFQDLEGKPFRQLLCFSLSAISILDTKCVTLLDSYVSEQLSFYDQNSLKRLGCLDGIAGSGNQAMFYAIFLIHSSEYMGINTSLRIKSWIELHIKSINSYGFWGDFHNLTHLQFQNGYHQYEIFEYLNVNFDNHPIDVFDFVSLADKVGHFAPYPGGGGCYDYDAIFLLTSNYISYLPNLKDYLIQTSESILYEMNDDSGFCENILANSYKPIFYALAISHLYNSLDKPYLLKERLKSLISIHLPKNYRVRTHWTKYSRKWNESNLWDTWFRLLTLAKVDVFLNPENLKYWYFINYPGIGYHKTNRGQFL